MLSDYSSLSKEKIFLGIFLSSSLQEKTDQIDPGIKAIFLKDNSYLQIITANEKQFLGKYLALPFCICDLEELEAHILSITYQLVGRLTPSPAFYLIPSFGS